MNDPKFWRYDIPSRRPLGGWGVFVIDSTGYFSCVTDWGNYAYYWTHHGCRDFREFLVDLDPSYLCGKLGRREYSEDKTKKLIREDILAQRKSHSLSKEEARKEWALLEEHDFETPSGFGAWVEATSLSDAWELAGSDFPYDLRMFATDLYPRFVAALKEDLFKGRLPLSDWEFERTGLWASQWVRRTPEGTAAVWVRSHIGNTYEWVLSREIFGNSLRSLPVWHGRIESSEKAKEEADKALKRAIPELKL